MINKVLADFEGNDTKSYDEVIHSIDDYLLSLNPPSDFADASDVNIIRHMDNSFEKLCASMEEANVPNPKSLTTYEFYSRLEYFQSKKKK